MSATELTTDELAARAEELDRIADTLDPAERRRRLRELLDGAELNLSRVAADLEELQNTLDERDAPDEQTIYLPVHWGSPRSYILVIEAAAGEAGIRCRTSVSRTGLFSKEVAFIFTGPASSLKLLVAWIKDWASAAGIGWTPH